MINSTKFVTLNSVNSFPNFSMNNVFLQSVTYLVIYKFENGRVSLYKMKESKKTVCIVDKVGNDHTSSIILMRIIGVPLRKSAKSAFFIRLRGSLYIVR